ncbi:RNA polymerase sigma factor RpoE [Desulfocucumis palustris]|uniref:RNA polymerase sigma factor RpoE n=1 Tax=Desulfocucumis palustris TaxID=1898651 RepID=A0A2L2XGX4_9FIRM|nr:sigma-70 family RNA polymerase sigma factor [Desulfocucumis palustris]GBF35619.1 RNA polymerase sigma factor RpoE [Desulfocucumis palustris]
MGDLKTDVLIERCRQGSEAAFSELIQIYQNRVYTICFQLTGNSEDAKDLAQETFIRLYGALPGFRGQSAFTTWLYRIIHNLWANELRKRKNKQTISLNAPIHTEEGEIDRTPADEKSNPEQLIEAGEERKLIWTAIDTLNQEQRTVLVLRELHGYSYEEIARGLGWSPGTVKSRLNRARLHLKEQLLKLGVKPDKESQKDADIRKKVKQL